MQDVCVSCDPQQTELFNECTACVQSGYCWSYIDAADLFACVPAGTTVQTTETPSVQPPQVTQVSVDVCEKLNWCNDNGLCAETSLSTGKRFDFVSLQDKSTIKCLLKKSLKSNFELRKDFVSAMMVTRVRLAASASNQQSAAAI